MNIPEVTKVRIEIETSHEGRKGIAWAECQFPCELIIEARDNAHSAAFILQTLLKSIEVEAK